MLEFLIGMGALMAGLVLAGFICMGLAWVFNHGPLWAQITVIVAIVGFFVFGIVDGIINYDDNPTYYYEDSANGFDRYR